MSTHDRVLWAYFQRDGAVAREAFSTLDAESRLPAVDPAHRGDRPESDLPTDWDGISRCESK
ncbi:MAG: hypothetical protein ABEJ96_04695 [Thiohalorhabdaceae bacterium]